MFRKKTKTFWKKLRLANSDAIITAMNTLNTIINSINQNINETVIDGLTSVGYDHREATKLVVEDNFSVVEDALENPVETF